MESWLFSEVVPRYLLSDWDGDLTGLLPCAALINVACQAAVVASDVSPRLFLQEVTSPEHVTWKTTRLVLCFKLEWRAEGLTLSQVDWRRINMGLTTTWNYSNGQICVALVINSCAFVAFCAVIGGVCTTRRERTAFTVSQLGWKRSSTLVCTFVIPESWRRLQEACCLSGEALFPEPQDEIQEGVKVLCRKLAGSPRQSPSHLCLSAPVGFLRLPGLFKTLHSPDCHPPPSCVFGSDANRVHSLLTFATLELHTSIRCKWSIDLQPGRGKSSPRWHFKVALGLCNGHPSCAHQNLNDTSTFTPLWKTKRRLISAPVLRIPEHFHEAF